MTLKHHFRMTASEIAMGRYMRAPDHPAAGDDEFNAAFDQFGKDEKPAAGAADDKGGGDGSGSGDAPAGEPGGAAGGADDGGAGGGEGAAAGGADDKGGAAAPTGEPAAGGADGGAAADDKGGAAGGDGKSGAAPADDKGGAPAKAPAAAAPAASETDDDVLKRLAAAVKKVGDDEKPAAAADDQPAPLFTAEEEAKIEHFRKEWPEVAEAFDLQARQLAQSVLKYAFEQIGGVVNPMKETLDILATRTHYGDLKDKVGEYSAEERDAIVGWVNEQPTYLQKPMLDVIESGTAEEVADLVGRYREATGQPKPAGAGAGGEAPGKDVELSEEAKKAALALAPVDTKRTAVQAPDDTSDFDGAFAKFADVVG